MRTITISTRGYIAPLLQDGPIVTPIRVDDPTVFDMIRKGYNVFEHSTSLNKSIRLNTVNFDSPTRFTDSSETPAPSIGTEINGLGAPIAMVTGSTTPIVQPASVDTATAAVDMSKLTKAERKALRRANERSAIEVTGEVEIVAEETSDVVEGTVVDDVTDYSEAPAAE